MGVLNGLRFDPLGVLRQWDGRWADVLAGVECILGTIAPCVPDVEEVTRSIRAGSYPDLDKAPLLQGEQLFVHQCEGKPQEFCEVVASTPTLNVEHLQDQIAYRVSRQTGIGQ